MDWSVAWDATLHIIFDLFIIGVGNAAGSFLADTMGTVGLAFYLLVAVPTLVYGMFYAVTGAEMVVEAATERAFEAAELTAEVNDGDDGGEGRDSDGNKGDDTESPARD